MDHERELKVRRWPVVLVPDAGLAILVTLLLLAVERFHPWYASGIRPFDAIGYILVAGAGLVLAVRRLFPLFTYSTAIVLTCVLLVLRYPPGAIWLAPLIALLTVVTALPLLAWAAAAIGGAVALSAANIATGATLESTALWAGTWLLVGALFGAGFTIRRYFLKEAEARTELARRAREQEALRRMAEERLRIARDMHDVVGHSLAVISLQAGVAEHLLQAKPDEVRKAITAIRDVSREALTDLRREIALLRGQGVNGDGLTVVRLSELSTLVDSMRDAGMQVEMKLDVDQQSLPEMAATTAYRIVQEALTNVVRHAGSKPHASVRVGCQNERLEVEVLDDGPGSMASRQGAGIEGMRERSLSMGGEFEAGNRPEGGFRVWASIPLSSR